MGAPGWPELAFCTASIERVRMVVMVSWAGLLVSVVSSSDAAVDSRAQRPRLIQRMYAIVKRMPRAHTKKAPKPVTRLT